MNLTQLRTLPFPYYGDLMFRGKCPKEGLEQITFFGRIRAQYPTSWGILAYHPRNEGLRSGGQLRAISKHRAEGMQKGASDIIIPGSPSFVCELKRRDATQSAWQDGQIEYLTAAKEAGAFACVAFGVDAAWEAFNDWQRWYPTRSKAGSAVASRMGEGIGEDAAAMLGSHL